MVEALRLTSVPEARWMAKELLVGLGAGVIVRSLPGSVKGCASIAATAGLSVAFV